MKTKALSTRDAAYVILRYKLLHFSEDHLDQMSSTEETREAAAREIIPDPLVNLDPDRIELIDQMRRFSPHPGCWRSLIRDLLAERQRQVVASE